ncbi:MAG: hypothetical protein GF368_03515 [Candidatus Aenigmarchaeota archaeon]|nr:hypothetical protein [Candidatus Aenigmarchaeota archaeon]
MKFKLIIFISVLIPMIYSFNFGTVPKNDYQSVEAGESTEFIILLWNLGQNSYPVNVRLLNDLPGWDIIVRPQEFVLSPTPVAKPPYTGGEYFKVSGMGIVKTETLRLFVKTPKNVEPGLYDLDMVAIAGDSDEQVSVLQERQFKLKLEVKEKPTVFERTYSSLKLTGEKINERVKNARNSMTGMLTGINLSSNLPFFLGLILIVIAIAIVIVK